MATANKLRPKQKFNPEASADTNQSNVQINKITNIKISNKQRRLIRRVIPPGPIANAIRKAIEEYHRGQWAIANAIGVCEYTIGDFVSNGRNLTLATAERLAAFFGIGLGNDVRTPTGSIITDLRSGVGIDPRRTCVIAKAAGIHKSSLCRFVRDDKGLDLPTAERLASVLNLQVVIAEKSHTKADPTPDPLGPLLDHLRSAVDSDPRSTYAIARAADVSSRNLKGFILRERTLKLATAFKVYKALGVEPHLAKLYFPLPEVADLTEVPAPDDHPHEPSPWDDWDASTCPVHVREDGHLVVFGKDKGPLRSENATQLTFELARRYLPDRRGGLNKNTLLLQFGTGARGLFARLKGIDADCEAAFQPPSPNKVGPYGIWRPSD